MYSYYNYVGDDDYVFGGERERMLERDTLEEMEKNYMLGSLAWPTQFDGNILLSKMDKQHLRNTVEFLQKKEENEVRKMWIKLMLIEVNNR
jgi:hypothetical protein